MNTDTGKLILWFTRAELLTSIVEVVDMDCLDPTDSCKFVIIITRVKKSMTYEEARPHDKTISSSQ